MYNKDYVTKRSDEHDHFTRAIGDNYLYSMQELITGDSR